MQKLVTQPFSRDICKKMLQNNRLVHVRRCQNISEKSEILVIDKHPVCIKLSVNKHLIPGIDIIRTKTGFQHPEIFIRKKSRPKGRSGIKQIGKIEKIPLGQSEHVFIWRP